MSEWIVFFILIIIFGFITDGIVIWKRSNIITLDTMGPDLETKCPQIKANLINENSIMLSNVSGVILFVREGCISCQTLMKEIDYLDYRSTQLYPLVVGEKNSAENFYKEHTDWKHVGYIEDEFVIDNLKIISFPFYMYLENGIVKEKGFPLIEKITRG